MNRHRILLAFVATFVAVFGVLTVADVAKATNTCTEQREVPIYVKWVRERKNVHAPWGDWYLYDNGSVTSLSPGSGYLSPLMQYEYRESGRTKTVHVEVPCPTTTTAAPATTTTEATPSSTSPATTTTSPSGATTTLAPSTTSSSPETSVVPPSSASVPPSTPSSESTPAGNCQPTGECNPTSPPSVPPSSTPSQPTAPQPPAGPGQPSTPPADSSTPSTLPATGPVTDGIIPAATAGLIGGLALVAIARRRRTS